VTVNVVLLMNESPGVPFEHEPRACMLQRCQRFGVELFRCLTDASRVTFETLRAFPRLEISEQHFFTNSNVWRRFHRCDLLKVLARCGIGGLADHLLLCS